MKRKITGLFVCMLLISAAIFSVAGIVNEELMPLSSYRSSSEGIIWDAMLNFSEPGGESDYVIFGEATDANDGEPYDIYDAPKPPLPMPPYLRAWFDDGLSAPYHDLWHDYRMYPDTFKVWDLYVRWKSSDATPINIDMTWDVSEFIGIEYEYIILNRYNRSNEEWDFAADLLTENYYTYAPEYVSEQWLIDHFQINAYVNRPPYVPSSPDPVDGAADVDVDTVLVWYGGDPDGDTVTYDVYFGTDIPPLQVVWNQSTTLYNPGTMNYNFQYYWRIVAWDNHGMSAEGPIWNFTTQAQPNDPPYMPSNPSPGNHSIGVGINVNLSWNGGDPDGDIVMYDVYFGTTIVPSQVIWNHSGNICDPGILDHETKYYWKVVAWDNHSASTTGPIWDFTTEELFVGWESPLDFTEPDGGYDNVFFGEKIDASDGQDIYDVPKSPPGMTPYIRAWFDTAFPDPHNTLWKEYKQYPDDRKVWNLSVQWVPDDYASPTNITISWNMSCLNTDEYTCDKLKNTGSGEAVNMLLNESYTFNASALAIHHFQIICSNEIHIANLQSKWNLFSLPFNQSVPKEDIIVCYNGVDYSWIDATTNNNPTGKALILGYIYYWNASTPQHYDLSDVFEPGYGYWIYAFCDCELWTEDFDIMINDGYITDLLITWNLMGLPNDVPLPNEDLIVRYNGIDYSWENATTNNNPTGGQLILGYIYYWNASTPQHYDLSDVFEPGYGYWMYAYRECTLKREPIIIDNSPDTVGTGNGFIFNASVSDSDGIDGVWVEYWYDGGTHMNDFMAPTGIDDYYEKMITISSDSVDPLHYIISANDTYNFWSITGEQTVTVVDDDAPEYSWILKPEMGTTGESVLVNVSAIDNIGVIYYKIIVDSVEYDMIKSNDDYTYVINTLENSIADIIYNCTFKDEHGNTVVTEDVTITVTDNDPPKISNVLATPSLTIQDAYINITCDVTDNVDVDTVMVNIGGPAGFTPVNTTMNEGSYYYNTSYSIVGIYSYFIWANDTSGNTITSLTYDFYIYDPTIFYVDDDYNSSTPGWGYDHFDIIQDGINASLNGDVVTVASGTYNESIEITAEITLQSSDGAETTIINASNGVTIDANNVIIRGFTVKQDVHDADDGVVVGTGFYNVAIDRCSICNYKYGILMLTDSHHNYILNCTLDSCNFGTHIKSHNSTIADNVAYNCYSDGFELGPGHYNYISNNTAYNNSRFGFNLETGSCHNTLIGNTAYDNGGYYTFYNVQGSNYNTYIDNTAFMTNSSIPLRYGFMFGQSDYCIVANNKVYNLSRDGILLGDKCDYNNITSNTIYNTRHGIHIYLNSDNNTVFNNTVHNSTTGVILNTNSNNNVVTFNDLLDNNYGVNLSKDAPSRNNTIYRNNIMRNTRYGLFNHDTESVDAIYNYWGHISGPYHPTSNPTGQGDNVSDNVDFIPWLDAPEGNPTSNPPEISNVVSNPESQVVDKFVNITCDVTDDLGVDTVKVNITGPAGFIPINETMNGGSYYYNRSYNIVGIYRFFIWANDTICNSNTSDVYTFSIITGLLLVDSESNDNADLISDTPTMMTIQHMDTDNNAVAPLSNSLIEWNRFDSMWDVTLDFTEPDGRYDNVFFGEKTDASDGHDSYDVPKPPSGITPYIRAWFDDGLPEPYDLLWKDYRQYPDTNKTWNLSVQWVPKDYQSPTDITISWDATEIGASEYNFVVLYDVSGAIVVADMSVDTEYIFTASAMTPKAFQIICYINEIPVPDLECDGMLRWLDIRPCDTATGEFTVKNIGDPGSLLDWKITEWPDFGCWHFEPDCGDDLKPEDGPVTIHASAIAPEMDGEHFFGCIEIINKNNYSDSDTINVYLLTTSWMTIEKPTNALYINNEKIIPFIVPVIIGGINIEVNTSSIIDTVMFFVDGELQHVDAIPPFTWTWDKIEFLRHALKIIIYDDNRIIDVDEIIVWKFF